MKKLFIPAIIKFRIDKSKILEISGKLPKEIAIAYSVQYINQAKEVMEILEKKHRITNFIQVLGCSRPVFSGETKAILLISDGKFHAASLEIETKLPVYILNRNNLERVPSQYIQDLEKKKKASLVKFLSSGKVGILVSTKPGQENLENAIKLKKKLKDKDKDFYLFIANNINTSEFENFPDIGSWINTACPRMDMNEKGVLNYRDIK